MVRKIAIAALAAAMFGCLPVLAPAAYAQETDELEGAPGWQKAVKPAPVQAQKPPPPQKKAVPPAPTVVPKQAQVSADKLKAEQAKLAQLAEAQKAEQARLAKQAADLKAQQARLDARAAELAAEEKRLAQLRIDQESAQAKLAQLAREREETAREAALHSERQRQTADLSAEANRAVRPGGDPDRNADEDAADDEASDDLRGASPQTRRPIYARFDFVAAERSCIRAGEDAALARNFYSARYDGAPSVFQDGGWELRGRMRLQDRRGYLLLDTVCEVDADGEAQRFVFLRSP
jgi:hypothetical protein